MTVRLKDIATRVGVSVPTVSLALSGHPRVAEPTRREIIKVASEMGYRSSSFRDPDETTIALILTDGPRTIHPLFHEAIGGLLDEAVVNKASVQIHPLSAGKEEGIAQERIIREAKAAVLMGGYFPERGIAMMQSAGIPSICIGQRGSADRPVSWVSSDYAGGCRRATERLITLGHKKIGLLLPYRWQNRLPERERVLGYRIALDEAGLKPGPQWEASDKRSHDTLADALRQWVNEGVTAVFATEYEFGVSALSACAAEGLSVPDDLAVIAFDDEPSAELLHPPLTTVRQPMRQLGAIAARTVLSWARGSDRTPVQVLLQTELVVRSSCGGGNPARRASIAM